MSTLAFPHLWNPRRRPLWRSPLDWFTSIGKVRGSTTGRPIMAALDLAGRRWLLRILWELREEALTFRVLQERCGAISPTVLRPQSAPSAAGEGAAGAQAERRTAQEPDAAAPPVVLVLFSAFALLFVLGWRVARHHGPG